MATDRGLTVTQRVAARRLPDLDRAPSRAALAFTTPDGPEAVPVVVRHDGDRLLVGARHGAVPEPPPSRPVLLVDDGHHWFELRAIVRRGDLAPAADTERDGLVWFRLDADREVAWDYAQLHQEARPHAGDPR